MNYIELATSSGSGILAPSEPGDYTFQFIFTVSGVDFHYILDDWTVSPPELQSISASLLSTDVN